MSKKFSDVFNNIRYSKLQPRGKAHSSTDDEEHYTVGEKEFDQQLKHAKKRAMQEGENKEMKKDPCWKGYEMVGMKDKNGKKVPNCVPVKEEEQIDEMPGANMDTRAVHKHLRKSGWALTRTKGSHDVYTHPKSTKHIAVPRHKQLKAPLVRGIMKDAQVSEDTALDTEKTNTPAKRSISKMTTIVKDAAKSAKEKNKFQAEPELSTQIIRVNI